MIGAARLEPLVDFVPVGEVRFDSQYRDPEAAKAIGQEALQAAQAVSGFELGKPVIIHSDLGNPDKYPELPYPPTSVKELVARNEDELRAMADTMGVHVRGLLVKVLVYDRHDDERLGMHTDPVESITIADALLGKAWVRTPWRIGHRSNPGSRLTIHTGFGRKKAEHHIVAPETGRTSIVTRLHYSQP